MTLSGPMFEPAKHSAFKSLAGKEGAHYNIYAIDETLGMSALRDFFPTDDSVNEMNFVLFSTSGIHGSYTTIEDIEVSMNKYGEEPEFANEDWPDDYVGNYLTVLVVQPRIVCMRYGTILVTKSDLPFLKSLRELSWQAVNGIGI